MKKPTKKPKMKKLGTGYIWFGGQIGASYFHVSLATHPSGHPESDSVRINTHDLGAWKKVRLWAEVVK